ncbi:unnamed protein product [Cylicocyclus nassatus]|uniref:Uncharacterized protein n=1 Tax=Cylicocyclus nassatus TaxID=53992 RepID=A0AA36MAD8_CYLNA|nr:unnamed protein product [Cylicocyclus nassatus]
MFVVVIFAVFLPVVLSQGGGMAELKSITGDEQYTGQGNPNAPIPRPMGFWGRPRFSPVGYTGAYMGNPCYTGGYGAAYGGYLCNGLGAPTVWEDGRVPFGDPLANAISGVADPLSQPSRLSAVHSSLFEPSPFENTFPSRNPGAFGTSTGKINTFSSLSPSGLSGSVPLSQATGGGFYTGKGNDFVGR